MSDPNKSSNGISVLMPTYKNEQFIAVAIKSLQLQTFTNWELIIIDDGSTDDTAQIINRFLTDRRIGYHKNEFNKGLGYCLNKALRQANFDLIAYLPSDDFYYKEHLSNLYDLLNNNTSAVLAYANVRSEYYSRLDLCTAPKIGVKPLQLVQVLHRKTLDLWVERDELVTDSLEKMFFNKLRPKGEFLNNNNETCEWVEHPDQRSSIINEGFFGGIYKYKLYYNVSQPLRFQSTYGNYIDEFKQYEKFRLPPDIPNKKALKILLVGELAYNPERIYAFEERGHKLYGLWLQQPLCFNTVGPLPFGNVEDIPYANWKEKVDEIKPDIIYSLLNVHTVDLAHEILMLNKNIPFIWHFKEGPFFSIKSGCWKKVLDLYNFCDGQIFTNQETQDWFNLFLKERDVPTFLLDGDLPKKEWFTNKKSKLLSDKDGEIHTVITGRPMGFEVDYVRALAEQKIHLHFYGELFQSLVKNEVEKVMLTGNPYFHIHPHCDLPNWVEEFSRYDAGWLHLFDSHNYGELLRVDWNDLNYPARIPTLASAGLPMIQRNNSGHIVATQALTKKLDIGVFFDDIFDLKSIFENKNRISSLQKNAWDKREYFLFDTYVDDLVLFFENVILNYKHQRQINY